MIVLSGDSTTSRRRSGSRRHSFRAREGIERRNDAQTEIDEQIKLTEALVGDVEMPQVDSQVVCRDERFLVAVDGDGVDVVGVGIGKDLPGVRLDGG